MRIAAVATGFPSGQIPVEHKLAEVRDTVALGADEIDMVIDRAPLSGDDAKVFNEIGREGSLWTCAPQGHPRDRQLGTLDNAAASRLAMHAGGLHQDLHRQDQASSNLSGGPCHARGIREHYLETGVQVGMKPAGGIRTAKDALRHLVCC